MPHRLFTRRPVRHPFVATALLLAGSLALAPALQAQTIATPPPRLSVLPVKFNLNNLLETERPRYRVEVVNDRLPQGVESPRPDSRLTALTVPSDPGLTQDYFQFNLIDDKAPARQYSVFVAATQERCANNDRQAGASSRSTGRIMEIHHLTSLRDGTGVPQRSRTEKICANDQGALGIDIQPPGPETFRIRWTSQTAKGQDNQVFDYDIPRALDPVPAR